MRPFTFKLESVRALREQVEGEAKERLARELAAVAGRRAEVDRAAQALEQARSDAGSADLALSGPQLLARQTFVERREREQRIAHLQLAEQEREAEARRLQLVDASRDREVLYRLKERHRTAHLRAQARVEEAALGEIALAAHRRFLGDAA
jgi:flagellar export protein FliJ